MTIGEVVSLKEYFESRLAEQEKAREIAFQALDRRLESMNEFRKTISDQTNCQTTRREHETLQERVKQLELKGAEFQGKASQSSVNFATLVSVLGILIGIMAMIGHFIKHAGG